ncbi:MAG: cytochrome c4 [Gammaproteobacteria bacterium]|nr:cytochrome c4 [Gammaproteobacteria bacterium]
MTVSKPVKYTLMSCLLFGLNAHAVSPNKASLLANACAGCHGPNGSSQGPATPSIAEMSPVYFIESMSAFKTDERPATVMNRIAKGYTKEQIKLMADFFYSQKMLRTEQLTDPAMASLGEKLHAANCEKCHAKGGRESADDSGLLAGQKIPYLRYTIQDILNGDRAVSRKMFKRLSSIHDELDSDGIEQLLHYYGSQK